MVVLRGSRLPHVVGTRHEDEFDISAGQRMTLTMTWFRSHHHAPAQHYDTTEVDASLLLLPSVGFIPADDPRFLGTVRAVEQELLRDGLVLRYRTDAGLDGLPGDEHPFLACSFWLVTAYAMIGRLEEGHALMRKLVVLANDVGLMSEEYDPINERMVANCPQAFSHLALIGAANALQDAEKALSEAAPSEETVNG